jgi:ferric-dicitrate binding protein FerR (iron transport regulator)
MLSRSLIGIVLTVIVSVQLGVARAAELRTCAVDSVEGSNAQYWEAGAWLNLAIGLAVPLEAKIVTGAYTRVRIVCDDGAVVTIGTETELNLENLVSTFRSRQSVAMQLINGVVGLFVPRLDKGGFEVRTPVAIASVRSTEWLVEWRPGEAAAVFVRSGQVTVRGNIGEPFVLKDGEGITVTAAGVAGEVKTWSQERIAVSTGRLGFDWQ